ncbi:hypothetical protein PC116_g34322 [Phytophthora cactorum]|nr:hypothetical protein PC116_g34322 [Phytophthora cactorum]
MYVRQPNTRMCFTLGLDLYTISNGFLCSILGDGRRFFT